MIWDTLSLSHMSQIPMTSSSDLRACSNWVAWERAMVWVARWWSGCTDLYDWQKCINNFGSRVFNLLIPRPLFQLGHIVPGDIFVRHRVNWSHERSINRIQKGRYSSESLPYLHSPGPVTHVLPQKEVVQAARAQEIEHLRRASYKVAREKMFESPVWKFDW